MNNPPTLKDIFIRIGEWLRYLVRNWKLLLIAGVLGAVIGFFIVSKQKAYYVASLLFITAEEKSGSSGFNGLASQLGIGMGASSEADAFSGNNLIALMQSRSLIEKTLLSKSSISGQSLADVYVDIYGWKSKWPEIVSSISFPIDKDRSHFSRQQDSLLEAIYGEIKQKYFDVKFRDKQTTFIEVTMKSENELFAKQFVEAMVSEVSESYIQIKAKKYIDNVAILQHQTDSVRSKLNAAITGVASTNDETFNLNPALQMAKLPSQYRQFDVQMNTAVLTELVKNLEQAKLSVLKETPLIQVIERPILPLYREKFSKKIGLFIGGLTGLFYFSPSANNYYAMEVNYVC